jgi:hypothetical protein
MRVSFVILCAITYVALSPIDTVEAANEQQKFDFVCSPLPDASPRAAAILFGALGHTGLCPSSQYPYKFQLNSDHPRNTVCAPIRNGVAMSPSQSEKVETDQEAYATAHILSIIHECPPGKEIRSLTPDPPGSAPIKGYPPGDLSYNRRLSDRRELTMDSRSLNPEQTASSSGCPSNPRSPSPGGFCYAAAVQQIPSGTTGATGLFSLEQPFLSPTNVNGSPSGHTLAELAVISGTNNSLTNNIIEVGWIIDANTITNLSQVYSPRLFVFNWINGIPQAYNNLSGSSFIPNTNSPYQAGKLISSPGDFHLGQQLRFTIKHNNSKSQWEIYVETFLIGTYPDTIWGSTFTSVNNVQWFGEVQTASNLPNPITAMGSQGCSTLLKSPAERWSGMRKRAILARTLM